MNSYPPPDPDETGLASDPDNWDWGPPKERPESWPDDPDVRRSMEWFRSLIPATEWKARRFEHVKRLHGMFRERSPDDLPQRFVAGDDFGGWYLQLAEAFVDHIADYEPAQGSRVIPYFKVMGRDFDLLKSIGGIEDRARRMLTHERGRADSVLFEIASALAYKRDGYSRVDFLPEQPGVRKVPDFEAERENSTYRVECKRLERSDYSKAERDSFWRLWRPVGDIVRDRKISIFFDLVFREEIDRVPITYLKNLALSQLSLTRPLVVDDQWCTGKVSWTDLGPIQEVLKSDVILHPSQRLFQLLTGEYEPTASYAGFYAFKAWKTNGRYIDDLSVATIARWKCLAPSSVRAKARHFLRQLHEANRQLEGWGPGIVHLGLEAMEGAEVEVARRPRVLQMIKDFDPRDTDLAWIYIHYFLHESPPDEAWAIEETTDWFAMKRPAGAKPRKATNIVVGEDATSMPHPWER